MRSTPSLVLVDPRVRPHAALRQRLLPITIGIGIAALSAIPYGLTLLQ